MQTIGIKQAETSAIIFILHPWKNALLQNKIAVTFVYRNVRTLSYSITQEIHFFWIEINEMILTERGLYV